MQKILVLNAGSSSLKFQLFSIENDDYTVVAKGNAERIGLDGSFIALTANGKKKDDRFLSLSNHEDAITAILNFLQEDVLRNLNDLSAVGHRVVHGGEDFSASILINEKVIQTIEKLVPLAPLHNPANLLGIRAVQKRLPNIPQVAVFDTAFHQTMEKSAFLYPLPLDQYERHMIRRYGFHGTSHRYVSEKAATKIGKKGKIITCHLGNGASLCAVNNGQSVDTSMGFTPLSGVMMGTRCGDIDPYIPLYLMQNEKMSLDDIDTLLNKKSGLLGLSGNADMREVEARYYQGDLQAMDALNVYVHALVRFIGQYVAILGGVDAIVFTAGVGEMKPIVRKMVCAKLSYLGIDLDEAINEQQGEEIEITKPGSTVRVFVIPTNEELVIAQDTKNLIQ